MSEPVYVVTISPRPDGDIDFVVDVKNGEQDRAVVAAVLQEAAEQIMSGLTLPLLAQ